MIDEERQAIEALKSSMFEYEELDTSVLEYFDEKHKILLNLIEKQQEKIVSKDKEIKILKEMHNEHVKEIEKLQLAVNVVTHEKGEWIEAYTQEKDEKFEMLNNSIPKQKIKDKIEELKQMEKTALTQTSRDIARYKYEILELLEEEQK